MIGELPWLPICEKKREILDFSSSHRVFAVTAGTGSGKSVMLPVILLELFQTAAKAKIPRILVVEPKRIQTKELAKYSATLVATYNSIHGTTHTVGHRMSKDVEDLNAKSSILYGTAGYLLRWLTNERLSSMTHIVLDEAHELTADFEILCYKLRSRMDSCRFTLIIMSATLNVDIYSRYFTKYIDTSDAILPVINAPGRSSLVKSVYLDELIDTVHYGTSDQRMQLIARDVLGKMRQSFLSKSKLFPEVLCLPDAGIDEKMILLGALLIKGLIERMDIDEPGYGVLVFLPGEADVSKFFHTCLMEFWSVLTRVKLVTLSSKSKDNAAKAAFSSAPVGIVKVVIMTDVGESSITIADSTVVIDYGQRNAAFFEDLDVLKLEWASQSSIHQRRGRAARVAESGQYFGIYEKFMLSHFQEYNFPETQTTSVVDLTLKVYSLYPMMASNTVLESLIHPPSAISIDIANQKLVTEELALPGPLPSLALTFLGKVAAKLGLKPSVAKVLILGTAFQTPVDSCILAAAMALNTPFIDYSVVQTQTLSGLTEILKESSQTRQSMDHFDSEPMTALSLFADWISFSGSTALWCEERKVEVLAWEELCMLASDFATCLLEIDEIGLLAVDDMRRGLELLGSCYWTNPSCLQSLNIGKGASIPLRAAVLLACIPNVYHHSNRVTAHSPIIASSKVVGIHNGGRLDAKKKPVPYVYDHSLYPPTEVHKPFNVFTTLWIEHIAEIRNNQWVPAWQRPTVFKEEEFLFAALKSYGCSRVAKVEVNHKTYYTMEFVSPPEQEWISFHVSYRPVLEKFTTNSRRGARLETRTVFAEPTAEMKLLSLLNFNKLRTLIEFNGRFVEIGSPRSVFDNTVTKAGFSDRVLLPRMVSFANSFPLRFHETKAITNQQIWNNHLQVYENGPYPKPRGENSKLVEIEQYQAEHFVAASNSVLIKPAREGSTSSLLLKGVTKISNSPFWNLLLAAFNCEDNIKVFRKGPKVYAFHHFQSSEFPDLSESLSEDWFRFKSGLEGGYVLLGELGVIRNARSEAHMLFREGLGIADGSLKETLVDTLIRLSELVTSRKTELNSENNVVCVNYFDIDEIALGE